MPSTRPRSRTTPPPASATLELPAFAAVAFATDLRADAGAADDAGPVSVAGMAVPWNVVVNLNFWGDTVEFDAGSIEPDVPGHVPFLLDHREHAMGYGVSFTDTGAGLDAVMAIPRDELVDADTARAVRQMANGVRTALSIGAVIVSAERTDKGDHDHYKVTAARLVELSSVLVPRFDEARVSTIAASALHAAYLRNGVTMPAPAPATGLPPFPRTTAAPLQLDAGDPPDPDDDDGGDGGDDDTVEQGARQTNAAGAGSRRHPAGALVPYQQRRGAARDTSLAAVSKLLAASGGDPRLIKAALANVTTADVPGLVRPQYVDELVGLLTIGTPVISAFRQGNLTSNPIVFPKWTTLPVVDVVTGEKVAIPTGPVVIGSQSLTVATYAGGNDASVQVIDWSSPAFLEEYFKAATEVYARKIETVFETALLAAATAIGAGPFTSLTGVIGNMIGRTAGKGLPGNFVLIVSGDVFGMMFSAMSTGGPGIWGIVNANFPTPPVIVAPFFPAGTVVGALTGAAISFQNQGAPVRLRAVDVNLLGVDLGVYGYFAAGVLYSTGLWKATMTVPAPTEGDVFRTDTPDEFSLDLLADTPPADAIPASSSARASKGS